MSNTEWEMGVAGSDLHIPFEDPKSLDLFFYFIKHEQPKYVVLNGDVMDCWEISKFDRTPRTGHRLKDELEQTYDTLKHLRKIAPQAQIVWVEGNHEFRLKKYIISRAPELYDLRHPITLPEQLDLAHMGIEYVASPEGLSRFDHNWWQIGDLYIGHFNKVNKHAGLTPKNLLQDLGVSHIQGHTHRFGISSLTLVDRQIIGVEHGCLCDLKPSYLVSPNWQSGFSVFFKKPGKPRFQVFGVNIPDYQFFYGSQSFTYEEAHRELYANA